MTSNPTMVISGSALGDIIEPMVGDPVVFVSGIGLYNSNREMVAVAKLNQPQKKTYGTNLSIGVKIDG